MQARPRCRIIASLQTRIELARTPDSCVAPAMEVVSVAARTVKRPESIPSIRGVFQPAAEISARQVLAIKLFRIRSSVCLAKGRPDPILFALRAFKGLSAP